MISQAGQCGGTFPGDCRSLQAVQTACQENQVLFRENKEAKDSPVTLIEENKYN